MSDDQKRQVDQQTLDQENLFRRLHPDEEPDEIVPEVKKIHEKKGATPSERAFNVGANILDGGIFGYVDNLVPFPVPDFNALEQAFSSLAFGTAEKLFSYSADTVAGRRKDDKKAGHGLPADVVAKGGKGGPDGHSHG